MKSQQRSVEQVESTLITRLATIASKQNKSDFLEVLVAEMADLLSVSTVLIGELSESKTAVNVVVMVHNGQLVQNVSYLLEGTPCESLLGKQSCFFPKNIQQLFPADDMLQDIHAESYMGQPIFDQDDEMIGIIAVLDQKPMSTNETVVSLFQLFTSQTSFELQKRKMTRQVRRFSKEDSLTGWMERHHFYDLLEETLIQTTDPHVLFFVDIDNFRLVNESVGHFLGDQVLRQFSWRLKQVFKDEQVILCRYSGDQFVIVVQLTAKTPPASLLAQALNRQLKAPILLQGKERYVTASIGVSRYPADAPTSTLLVERAEAALEIAKKRGKNNIVYFSEDMVSDRAAHQLKNDLYEAITDKQFMLMYQPKQRADGKVTGCEALIRWNHPTRGFIPPDQFIPLAEETGLINLIGDWVLEEACRQVKEWQEQGITGISVAVNVSAVQFSNEDIIEDILSKVRAYDIPFESIIVEITEGMAMQDPDWTYAVIHELSQYGIRVQLDDFGTGFSSLNYLSRFPVEAIKIDRSFVQNIGEEERDTSIVNALLSIAEALQINVVAEGVETKQQVDYLVANGCIEMQGFYFNKPLLSHEIEQLLKKAEK